MAAFLGIASGVINCLSGAVGIMSAFKKTHSNQIIGSGQGTGFFKFYSTFSIGGRSMRAERSEAYVEKQIKRLLAKQSPEIQDKMNEIIESLQDALEFQTYDIEDHRSINTVAFNKRVGKLYFYIYAFEGIPESKFGYIVKHDDIRVEVDMELAKDWIIVSKMKSSFMKCTMNQEIQYLPDKSIGMTEVINAISIAMAPAALGLVKVPQSFLNCMGAIIQSQVQNPDNKIVPCPNPELAQQALGGFQQMLANQQQSVQAAQDGLDKIDAGLGKIGETIKEKPATNSAERLHHRQHHYRHYGFGIPETHRYRHHLPYDRI